MDTQHCCYLVQHLSMFSRNFEVFSTFISILIILIINAYHMDFRDGIHQLCLVFARFVQLMLPFTSKQEENHNYTEEVLLMVEHYKIPSGIFADAALEAVVVCFLAEWKAKVVKYYL